MTMVERVARAMYEIDGDYNWDEATDTWKTKFYERARVAIEAMRLTTDEMNSVGERMCDELCIHGGGFQDEIWAAMIDAALAAGGGE